MALRHSLLLALVVAGRLSQAEENHANPVRKVVNLLQSMQKKVAEEGEKEKVLYEKFMCYCKTGITDLSSSINAAETKQPQLASDIKEGEEALVQTKGELKSAQSDRAAAKAAMAEATGLRAKEAAAFKIEKEELDANLAAVNAASAAISKGMAGSFVQTDAAHKLKAMLSSGNTDVADMDRQELMSFLSGGDSAGYAPASGEVLGILKGLSDEMSKNLAEITENEKAAIKSYEELMGAKTKEVEALTQSIESKTKKIGELGVSIVQMKNDLDDTEAALMEDQKFLKELEKGCSTKTAEWEARQKTRAEELVAISETIKILNDDDALELFKKTLPAPGASFVQVRKGGQALSAKAAAKVREAMAAEAKLHGPGHAALDFITMALTGRGSKVDFSKVIKMIDDMVALLKKEQVDDDAKKEYCAKQFDQMDDKKKTLEKSISDAEATIENAKEGIATVTDEIATLEKGIKALDKSVMEASEQRKEENAEYNELVAADSAAKELLNMAKNRLNKFYNPKLYKAPPKEELSEAGRIEANMAGSASFAQVAARIRHVSREAPPPPPETFGAYSKKSQESTGVIGMIDLLIQDLDKELTEAKTEEKNSQADYEETMQDASAKRAADSKTLTEKIGTKADLEGDLEESTVSRKSTVKELMATMKYIQSLHAECDWLIQYYDVRKEARSSEISSLKDAKAVLSGADFSLVQTKQHNFLGRL